MINITDKILKNYLNERYEELENVNVEGFVDSYSYNVGQLELLQAIFDILNED